MSFDIFDVQEEAQASSDSTVSSMMKIAQEIIETELQIEAMEETLKDLKGRNNYLKTSELPDLMAECGMSSVTLETGHVIEIQDFVQGSLPKEFGKRKTALEWLAANGASDLIKTEVSVEFGKTEHNVAKSLAGSLRDQGFPVEEQEGIHHQTLLAFVREKMRNGEEIPLESLGLFSGRAAKIKMAKGKK